MIKMYEYIWRNKFLCTDCKTFDEFIERFEHSLELLKVWRNTGEIHLSIDGISDDYAHFYTTNKEIADEWEFLSDEDVATDSESCGCECDLLCEGYNESRD